MGSGNSSVINAKLNYLQIGSTAEKISKILNKSPNVGKSHLSSPPPHNLNSLQIQTKSPISFTNAAVETPSKEASSLAMKPS